MGLLDLELTIHASGEVPARVAWERYERLDLWPTWSPQLRKVSTDLDPVTGMDDDSDDSNADDEDEPDRRPQSRQRLSPGLSGRVHGPGGLWAQFAVLTVDAPAMSWSWQVRRGPLVLQLHHRITGTPTGSRTSLTLLGPGPVILGYAPVAWYALHRLVSLPASEGNNA
jgi:hypothetical protein